MKKIKWHSGPPPSVGWWPASRAGDLAELRWWNGDTWSVSFYPSDNGATPHQLAHFAPTPFGLSFNPAVKWRERPKSWPKRSRT